MFKNGVAKVYILVGPQKKSSNESIRLSDGFVATYINLKGEVIWQGEIYETQL